MTGMTHSNKNQCTYLGLTKKIFTLILFLDSRMPVNVKKKKSSEEALRSSISFSKISRIHRNKF